MASEPRMSLDRVEQGDLRVRLSGTWVLGQGIPPFDEVRRELLAEPPPRELRFDLSELKHWDSGVLTFLDQVHTLCADKGVKARTEDLPEGLRRLLDLASAVPETKDARAADERPSVLERIGAGTWEALEGAKEMVSFLGEVTASVGRLAVGKARFRWVDLIAFIQDAGAQALPIVGLISFLVGLILAFVGAIQLEQFGAEIYVANLVGIAMAREMGGMMAAIIMAGRTGAAYAAQLGTMTVNQEIDALRTMGLPPIDFLVLPRVIALCLMMPLLTIYADFIGIIGGGVVAAMMLNISPTVYYDQLASGVQLADFTSGLLKAVVFGILVAFCGCLRGMQCGSSASAVGKATTSAVVTAIVMIIVADSTFTVIFTIIDF